MAKYKGYRTNRYPNHKGVLPNKGKHEKVCYYCGGKGIVATWKGTGKKHQEPCPSCDGAGKVTIGS